MWVRNPLEKLPCSHSQADWHNVTCTLVESSRHLDHRKAALCISCSPSRPVGNRATALRGRITPHIAAGTHRGIIIAVDSFSNATCNYIVVNEHVRRTGQGYPDPPSYRSTYTSFCFQDKVSLVLDKDVFSVNTCPRRDRITSGRPHVTRMCTT